jgi:Domain of unknown function (DUF4124)
MKHWKYSSILLMVLSLSANAEVFKCKNAKGKIIYQPAPCSSEAATQGVVKVKVLDPQKDEEARAKLNAWQGDLAAKDAAKQEAEKQRQAELEKQESLELQRRSIIAQEKQAEESLDLQRRSVIAQEQQAIAAQQRRNQPIIVAPPYGGGRYWNNGGFPPDSSYDPNMMQHHPHHHHEQGEQSVPPPQSPSNLSPPHLSR